MENGYVINLSCKGIHVFATSPHSATDGEKARELTELIEGKFPEKDGYKVTVTKWQTIGQEVTF